MVPNEIKGTRDAGDFWFRFTDNVIFIRTPKTVTDETGIFFEMSVVQIPRLDNRDVERVVGVLRDHYQTQYGRLVEHLKREN